MATRAVSTVITYRAWDTVANAPKTGDVANHTLKWIKDGTSSSTTNSPSEVDATNAKGIYKVTLTATETDCTFGVLAGVSSTASIAIFGVQVGFEYVPNAAAGASGGLLISGSNSGATTFGAITCTGSFTISDGLLVSRSSSNTPAISATGNGTGVGLLAQGGATGAGLQAQGGASGAGARFVGGSSVGNSVEMTTSSGDGLSITPTFGSAIIASAHGTSKHGAILTGGTAGTSDGLKCVAGSGGVDLRANLTGALTGNLSGSVGSVAATVNADVIKVNGDSTAADLLLRGVSGNVEGTVGSGSTTTSIVTSALLPAASVADQYKARLVTFAYNTTTTALRGQSTDITTNTNAGVLTVTALTTAPVSGDTFVIT